MKVIMTGGGTGGHIYPAIAIADKIKEKNSDAEILFVGTKKGLEKELVPKNGYPIEFITVSGFYRKHLIKNAKTIRDLVKGLHEAKKIIKEFKPDIVIGTGGYVCGPVVREAAKMGIPTFIHEQNAFPGVTNKLLAHYVKKIFLAFPNASEYFEKYKDKLVVTGNPVRSVFFTGEKDAAREKLGIPGSSFVILSFGGSQGAGRINGTVCDAIPAVLADENTFLVLATGKNYYNDVREGLEQSGASARKNLRVLEYIDNMADYLKAADLVISRSGALTVSEITTCGAASILVPSPNVTGNHQYHNARAVSEKGGAILIEDKEFTGEKLREVLSELKENREILSEMGEKAKALSFGDAAGVIVDEIMKTVR